MPTTRQIVTHGHPALRRVSGHVLDFETPALPWIIETMFNSMYAARGIGLAAPQIAISLRIVVLDVSFGSKPDSRMVLINPEIIAETGSQREPEGCLSVPGFNAPIRRAQRVTVKAQDVTGATFEVTGEGLLARAFQHEIDHLNGLLYLDRLSSLKRASILRKLRKLRKAANGTR